MLAVVQSIFALVGTLSLAFDSMRASRRLFESMLTRIMRATPRFFDVTPLGRIISRYCGSTIVQQQLYLADYQYHAFQYLFMILIRIIVNEAFNVFLLPTDAAMMWLT